MRGLFGAPARARHGVHGRAALHGVYGWQVANSSVRRIRSRVFTSIRARARHGVCGCRDTVITGVGVGHGLEWADRAARLSCTIDAVASCMAARARDRERQKGWRGWPLHHARELDRSPETGSAGSRVRRSVALSLRRCSIGSNRRASDLTSHRGRASGRPSVVGPSPRMARRRRARRAHSLASWPRSCFRSSKPPLRGP